MRLFSNEALNANEIDFRKCETLNGDYMEISNASPELLEKYISYFEVYIQKYPKHVNHPIWKKYITILENTLLEEALTN